MVECDAAFNPDALVTACGPMPTPTVFAQAFATYLMNARTAQAESRHHDYRRGLFLDLLRQAFGIRRVISRGEMG